MAAPSNTLPAAVAPVPSSSNADAGALGYLRKVLAGESMVLQDAPLAIASEAAGLLQEVPIVGIVCKTFLAVEQLVDTASSNKEDLTTLRDLCGAGIKGVLDKRKSSPGLLKQGFAKLEEHVLKAEEVAKLCSGDRTRDKLKRFALARKISKDIAAARSDILAFCTVNTLVLADDTHVSCSCFKPWTISWAMDRSYHDGAIQEKSLRLCLIEAASKN